MPDRRAAAAPDGVTVAAGRPDSASPGTDVAASRASRIADQVRQFHLTYDLPVAHGPTATPGGEQVTLRQALIEEELAELRDATRAGDLVGVADALADIVYVAYGTACVYGIDLDAVLDEVHASNMTKLGADEKPVRRADGKILKGPGYRPPDIAGVLSRRT